MMTSPPDLDQPAATLPSFGGLSHDHSLSHARKVSGITSPLDDLPSMNRILSSPILPLRGQS